MVNFRSLSVAGKYTICKSTHNSIDFNFDNVPECRNSPTIDCSLYNSNITCDRNGIYYPWALENCPLFCGFCQGL